MNELDPSVLHDIARAAFAEVYAIDRKMFSDAEWRKVEPMLWRAFNAHARQFVVRYSLVEKGLEE